MSATKPIPDGYHTITPQLSIDGAANAIDFYKKAFGAEEVMRAPDPSGKKIWHAVMKLGTSLFFVNDVFPDMGGSPSHSGMWLYVADVDAAYERAVKAGAKGTSAPMDMFWGDRMAHILDPFGQTWAIATHTRDLSPEDMKKAQDEAIAAMKNKN
jgi:PhnB protein